jgi:hypothetical protein
LNNNSAVTKDPSIFAIMNQQSFNNSHSSNCDVSSTSPTQPEHSQKRLSFRKKLKRSFRSLKRFSISSKSLEVNVEDDGSDWLSKAVAEHKEDVQNEQNSVTTFSSNPIFGHLQSQRLRSSVSSYQSFR